MIPCPNLELIRHVLIEKSRQLYPKILQDVKYHDVRFDVFRQKWSSTSSGLDNEDSGQTFTDIYVTVCELSWYKRNQDNNVWIDSPDRIHGVFFENDLAYILLNPNKRFKEDLKNRRMVSWRMALSLYVAE